VWKACQNGAMSSFFTSVRFYCYDWLGSMTVKQPYKWARRTLLLLRLVRLRARSAEYLTRVMLTAWRNGQIMREAAALARSLNLQMWQTFTTTLRRACQLSGNCCSFSCSLLQHSVFSCALAYFTVLAAGTFDLLLYSVCHRSITRAC